MTAQCALYVGALKIFGLPDYAHGYYSPNFFECSYKIWESVALPVPEIIGGTQKIWAASGYAHRTVPRSFFQKF